MTKTFFKEIDIIKGPSIFLVIMQHCYAKDFIDVTDDVSPAFHYSISVYAMELFMVCSGFLYSRRDTWHSFLNKKCKRLLIPYLFFGILTIITRYLLSDYTVSPKPELWPSIRELFVGGYYWFLYVLFIFVVAFKIISNNAILIIIAALSFVGSYLYNGDSFIITRLIHHPFYFLLGMYIRHSYDHIRGFLKTPKAWLLLFILFVAFLYCTNFSMRQYEDQHSAQILGCAFTWILAFKISQHSSNTHGVFLDHLGTYSLQYYLNHLRLTTFSFFIISLLNINYGVINYILAIFLVVILSFSALFIEKKVRILRFLCGLR